MVQSDETLVEADANRNKFFVVVSGHLNIVRTSGPAEEVVAVVEPGMFTGEIEHALWSSRTRSN